MRYTNPAVTAPTVSHSVRVSAFEILVVACSIGAVLLFASWPFLEAWRADGDGMVFGGLLDAHEDYNTYFVKMEAGRQGRMLYGNPYQASVGERLPLHLFWVGLGWVARWLGTGLDPVFHAARVTAGGLFLFLAYRLLRACVGAARPSLLCFVLLTVSSGITGLLVHVPGFREEGFPWFADVLVPEANTFFSLMLNPAFLFSMAMMAAAARSLLVAVRGRGNGWVAGVSTLVLGIVHPTSMGTLWVILGAFIVVEMLLRTLSPRRAGALALRFYGSSAPAAAYHFLLWWQSPEVRSWVAQNVCLSPPPLSYLAGYGLLWPAALLGLVVSIRGSRPSARLVGLWLTVGFALLYAPVAVQRRLAEGYHLAVVMAVGVGLSVGRRQFLWPVLLILSTATTHLLWRGYLERAQSRAFPSFIEQEVLEGMRWLREERPGAVVVCIPEAAWTVTRYGGGRVVAGHWAETPEYVVRAREVRAFLTGAMGASRAERWLDEWAVRLLLWTPREKVFAGRVGPGLGYWSIAWQTRGVTIWELQQGTAGAGVRDIEPVSRQRDAPASRQSQI